MTARLRLQHCIVLPRPPVVDIGIGGHHIEAARQHRGHVLVQQCSCVVMEANKPRQFVVEARARDGVTVGEVHGCDAQAVEVALDVARLEVIVVAGDATPHFARRMSF